MKQHKYLLFLVFCLLGTLAIAQDGDLYRQIQASLPTGTVNTFRLESRGGDIQVVPAAGDSIRVTVRLSSDQVISEDAISRLERIMIRDTITDDRWEWTTDLDGMDLESVMRMVTIDYQIELPEDIYLEIVHRNGDISIDDRTTPVWVDLRLGSLHSGCLSGKQNRIILQLAKADIACLGNAEIDLTGSSLQLGTVNECSVRGKGAELSISKAGDVDIRAHAGAYHIGKATVISGTITSSQLRVDTLLQRGDLDVSFMLGTQIGLAEAAEGLAIQADLAPLYIAYPGERPVALDLEARRDDLRQIDIDGVPEPENLPDNQVRYRNDWGAARTSEPALELSIHSKRGRVEIVRND